ncbi:MAG: 2-oxoglutarate dehydrogenase complex dihydrolipoyllysine-residue succinyltransferase [Parvibaculum sp.]|nr:2-oxoglutarate dehydrogenase complex dihydrolipoyllysine-residue succinyltransferase [Parvibaculum sp.]
MATEVKVPALGESVTEATVAQWFKKPGDQVTVDEPLVELETDKVTVEVPAPASGVLSELLIESGTTVEIGAILATIGEGTGKVSAGKPAPKKAEIAPAPAPAPVAAKPVATPPAPVAAAVAVPASAQAPAVRRLVEENNLDASKIAGTGRDGRVTKGDAMAAAAAPAPAAPLAVRAPVEQSAREERVKMTRLRKTIATRLKEAQNTAAMLTTFNEVDMSAIMALRNEYKAVFEKKHGVRVGFMGFFVKACVAALKEIPAVNGLIDGDDIVYKNYYNIGVAVGTDKGLVVPVLKEAQDYSFADIEKAINDFGKRARDGALKLEELQGGTFTISNGGVYGSLMSTPILNAPQSGVLGMHKIQDRPMVVGGQIVVRPMMYLALSYDHRIVDGKEAVTFLVRVKETLEDPQRLLLDL